MATAFGTLSIDLVAKVAQFEKDLGAAARATERTANQIASAFGLITSAIGGLTAGVGVSGLVAIVRNVNNGVDAFNDLKDATGASIENISALEDVAARTGTSFDTVGASLVKFNQALGAAKPGTDAARAFEALGLSVRELKAQDPAEALRQTAVALGQFADDGDKARVVQELFGKSLREVAPFLADLAKQGELVATVTTEQAEAAERFNHELNELSKNALDASRVLVGGLVESLNTTASAYRAAEKQGDSFLTFLLKQTEIARLATKALEAIFGPDNRRGIEALGGIQLGSSSPGNQRAAARLLRQGAGDRRSIGDPFAADGKTGKQRAEEGIRPVTTELDRYVESLQRTIEKNQDLTEVQTAQLRISEAGAQGFSEAQREAILALAKRVDKERELQAAQEERIRQQDERIRIGRDLTAELGVDNSERAGRLARLLGQGQGAQFQERQRDLALLQEELDRFNRTAGEYGISLEQYVDAVKALFGVTDERLEKTRSVAEELGLTFTSAFEDAVVGGKNLSQVLKGLQQDLLRIVLRKTVTEPLGGFVSKQLGNLLGSILPSFDGGGYTGTGPRTGGLDGQGGFLSVVHPQESIVDHSRGQALGAPVTVINHFNVGDVASQAMLRSAMDSVTRNMQAAIARSVTRGGALAP